MQGNTIMIGVSFRVSFDFEKEIIDVTRICPIPRDNCEGCGFKPQCDAIQHKIEELQK